MGPDSRGLPAVKIAVSKRRGDEKAAGPEKVPTAYISV
jgi:hypothetical protein